MVEFKVLEMPNFIGKSSLFPILKRKKINQEEEREETNRWSQAKMGKRVFVISGQLNHLMIFHSCSLPVVVQIYYDGLVF